MINNKKKQPKNTLLNSQLWVAVYVLLPAAMARSHSEVSLELNCVQCVSPPQPVTQGTGRLSPANLPVEKGEGNKTQRGLFSAPGHSSEHGHLHRAAARGQSHNDVRRFIWVCAKDTFHSVVSCFLCVSCALLRFSLSLCILTHQVEIFSCEPTKMRQTAGPQPWEINHTDDFMDVVQEHRGPALNSSRLWKRERRRPKRVFVLCSV